MKLVISTLVSCVLCLTASAQKTFIVVPLGVRGGLDESNLSCYALAVKGTNEFICLDAGTVHYGIEKAINAGIWKGEPIAFQKANIKAYLISHPHLDHLAGMVLNATDDSPKQIYGTELCIAAMREKYFSWKSWANFTNEGETPTLNKYSLVHLTPGKEIPVQNTSMTVVPFVLSHSNPFESTAFLINHNGESLLYLGDTGSDETEKSDKLQLLWKAISPLISAHKLKAIFIETSYSNEQPLNLLFGHFIPKLLMSEMTLLANLAGKENLQHVPVVITHMKPAGDREATIKRQLEELNVLKLKLVFPEQAHLLEF